MNNTKDFLKKISNDQILFSNNRVKLSGNTFKFRVRNRCFDFINSGLSQNDKLMIFTGQGYDYWIDFLAALCLGIIVVPISQDIEKKSILNITKKLGVKYYTNKVSIKGLKLKKIDKNEYENKSKIPFAKVQSDDVSIILFTSGSTGIPKGVCLTYKGIFGNLKSSSKRLLLNKNYTLFVCTPFNFISSISHFLVATYSEARLFFLEDKMLKGEFLENLKNSKANAFGGAPIQLAWILELLNTEDEIKLDWAMTSGEHLRPEIIKKFNNSYKLSCLNVVYGLTELSGRFCILNGHNLFNNEFTVGYPINGLDYKIIDDKGKTLNNGEIGEVVAFGNYLMKGYLQQDWSIPKSKIDFFKTGDIGRKTKNGLLEILGRKDDVFKVSGNKISSILITDVLLEMNIFEDIFVKPVDDEIFGNSPKIFYVLKNNSHFIQSKVTRHLKKKLPHYKVSYIFENVTNIPRTGSGKVIRNKFKDYGK